jgi:hypothetical protein
MKEDIELTKMNNAFSEIMLTINPMLDKCFDTLGDACATVIVRQLAVEFSARYMFAVKILTKDDDLLEAVKSLTESTLDRLDQLIEDATELGLLRREK